MLTQELMIGKCEDVEIKTSCWAEELVTIQTLILPHNRIIKLPVLKDTDKGLAHIPKLFLQEAEPFWRKTADHKHVDPKLVATRRLMMLETSP